MFNSTTFFFRIQSHHRHTPDTKILTDQTFYSAMNKNLTNVIICDVFSPPVSGRMYEYTSLTLRSYPF